MKAPPIGLGGGLALVLLPWACAIPESDHSMETSRSSVTTGQVEKVAAQRRGMEGINEALMGALLFLDDTQVRRRPGRHHPRHDACVDRGCLPLPPGGGAGAPLPLPPVTNVEGEWANFIHIFPDSLSVGNDENESVIRIQDSNLFMVAATAYPLYLFDESRLPPSARVIGELRAHLEPALERFHRGSGYSFWPRLPGSSSSAPRVGPPNIPMIFGHGSRILPFLPEGSLNEDQVQWFADVFDRELNPFGADALANIPNDADDGAVGWVTTWLEARQQGGTPSDQGLDEMARWRDKDRQFEDGRDGWKPKDSGAFLTWLREEDLPPAERFLEPDKGVIPLSANNVDCVVNANALFAFALAGRLEEPVAQDALTLMVRAVTERAWPECGLYYPQEMIFPYALSRAFRDGRIEDPRLRDALAGLLEDLLDLRDDLAAQNPSRRGAFPGGADPTLDLSTALALSTLLNLGRPLAVAHGQVERYDRALTEGFRYLLASQEPYRLRFADTFNRSARPGKRPWRRRWGRTWQGGVYFAASSWTVAQWRSEAYTVAMVLEALTKYLLVYDELAVSVGEGRRLAVTRYSRSAERAADELTWSLRW